MQEEMNRNILRDHNQSKTGQVKKVYIKYTKGLKTELIMSTLYISKIYPDATEFYLSVKQCETFKEMYYMLCHKNSKIEYKHSSVTI